MRCGFAAPDRQAGRTGVVDRHRCTAGETGWGSVSLEAGGCLQRGVRVCLGWKLASWDPIPRLLCLLWLLWWRRADAQEAAAPARQRLSGRQREPCACVSVWVSNSSLCAMSVFVWSKRWDGGCSNVQVPDRTGRRLGRVRMIEKGGGGCWEDDDMRRRRAGGGVVRVQPALHAGQVTQPTTPWGYIPPPSALSLSHTHTH